MAVERGLSHNEGVLIQTPPPFSPKIEHPTIKAPEEPKPEAVDEVAEWHQRFPLEPEPAPGYFEYLAGLPEEWRRQETLAMSNNPAYATRVWKRLKSLQETTFFLKYPELLKNNEIQEPKELPLEIRNFRLWQRGLWRTEEFRKATKGRGFMGNFEVEFIKGQIEFNVKYGRNDINEVLVVEANRTTSEQELKAIQKSWGKKGHLDKGIQGASVKHTIQLVISDSHPWLTSTYYAVERSVNKNGISVPDFSFDSEADFITEDSEKRFIGWLAITLLQQ